MTQRAPALVVTGVLAACSRLPAPGPANAAGPAPADWQRCSRNLTIRALDALPGGSVVIGGAFVDGADLGDGATATVGGTSLLRDDGFVAVYDERNVLRWSRTIGTTGTDAVTGVAFAGDGVVVAGQVYDGPADLGDGPVPGRGRYDAFVASYGPSGQLRWAQRFASATDDTIVGLAADAADAGGDVVVVGRFGDGVDLPGAPAQPAGVYLVRLSPSGQPRGTRRLTGDAAAHAARVVVHRDGAITIVGSASEAVDLGDGRRAPAGLSLGWFVVHDRPGGERAWSRYFARDMRNLVVAGDAAGRIYLAGGILGTVDLGAGPVHGLTDGFVAAYTADGQLRWTVALATGTPGTGGDGYVTDLAVDATGGAVAVGRYSGRLALGPERVSTDEPYATFAARVGGGGAPQWLLDLGPREVNDDDARVTIDRTGQPIVAFRTDGQACIARRVRWAR